MNRSKEDANHIKMSSPLPDVEHAKESAGIVNAIKKKRERIMNSTKKKCERIKDSVSFWNKISVISCMTAVSIDPLFFYIAYIDHDKLCLGADKTIRTIVLVTRSLTDFTFLVHIVHNLSDAIKAAASESKHSKVQRDNSKVCFNWFGQAKAVAKKLSWKSFISDILAVLPIPQVLILALFFAPSYRFSEHKMTLNYMVLAQYAPRMYRIFTSSSNMLRRNSSIWFKASFYFFMYILSSHVVGAFWYFSSVEVQAVCWYDQTGQFIFQCDGPPLPETNRSTINATCLNPTGSKHDPFNYGSFLETVTAVYRRRTTRPPKFGDKLLYFVWWGLKNLSNFGTNIATSDFIWENCFAILVSGLGLVLFAFLIGNMQESMRSWEEKKAATDKVQMKEKELEEWMKKNGVPEKKKDAEKLKIKIMKKITENLKEEKNSELYNLFSLIPWNAMKDLKLSICMSMLKKVPRLQNMDEEILSRICDHLKPVCYSAKTKVFRMGEPLDSMLFVMEGIMLIYPTSIITHVAAATTTGSIVEKANTSGSPTTIRGSLERGDVYGDEQLLSWASPADTSDVSYADLPILTENVKCLSKVNGFVLTADDLKSVFSEYNLQGNCNSSRHLAQVKRSISRGTSMNRRNRINPSPRPGTEGGDEEADIQ